MKDISPCPTVLSFPGHQAMLRPVVGCNIPGPGGVCHGGRNHIGSEFLRTDGRRFVRGAVGGRVLHCEPAPQAGEESDGDMSSMAHN
jgi:hypothetical protein